MRWHGFGKDLETGWIFNVERHRHHQQGYVTYDEHWPAVTAQLKSSMSSITPTSSTGAVYQGPERRKAERSTTDMPAILRFQDRLQVIQGRVCDLSISGAGFMCPQAMAAHSKCTLQFTLPAFNQSSGPTLVVSAIVVCSMQIIGQAHKFRVNLQFVDLAANVRGHIDAHIRRSLGRG